MDRTKVENYLKNYKKGTYVKMTWRKVQGTFTKISKGVVRLTNATINTSAYGVDYLRFRTSKSPYHTTQVRYFSNGVEITQNEYEQMVSETKVKDWFAKHLTDIISIG